MLAPYGGIVEEMAVSVGERIEQGDLIAKLATTKEFAPVEGRVAGVFGQPGDNTESVTERYGAVLLINARTSTRFPPTPARHTIPTRTG